MAVAFPTPRPPDMYASAVAAAPPSAKAARGWLVVPPARRFAPSHVLPEAWRVLDALSTGRYRSPTDLKRESRVS